MRLTEAAEAIHVDLTGVGVLVQNQTIQLDCAPGYALGGTTLASPAELSCDSENEYKFKPNYDVKCTKLEGGGMLQCS